MRRLFLLVLLLIAFPTLSFAQGTPDTQLIPASDPRFRYEGRFDMSDPARPVVIWQASRVSVAFDGPTLRLLFSNNQNQTFFNATVDGVTKVVELRQSKPAVNATFSDLGPGRHLLTLFKRSEATAGSVTFDGIELARDAHAWPPPPPAYKTTMLFLGDSIAAGACVEDGTLDQWEDRRTHNAARSFTALTAAAFDADHQNISVSGIAVVHADIPTAPQIWDHVRPDPKSPRANLTKWTPQIVFVHLGDNDDVQARGLPFPANFTDVYITFIHLLRTAYPNTEIVLLQGGMWSGTNYSDLLDAWHAAVRKLESADKKISHYAFKHWTRTHPRIADHEALANELIGWLKQQDFMQHLKPS